MASILLITVGGVLFASAFVLLVSVIFAPNGHEDVDGFHSAEPDPEIARRTEIAASGRESSSLHI